VLDFNRVQLSEEPISVAINALMEQAEPPEKNAREYLGASAIGHECLRRVQYDWMCAPHLIRVGFNFAPAQHLGFSAAGGLFRGHADGILVSGPELPEAGFPCLWEHKCLGDKGWRTLERDGLEKAYPRYAAQVSLYQAYLDVTEHPAIFTAVNANTCARLHLLVRFNAEQAQIWSDRAVAVIEATRAGELLPRAYDDPADWRCKACGHRERCWNRP
jgi:hypothetical protein